MPKQYERIKSEMLKRYHDEDEAQKHAAMIFVAKGKTKKARSVRARALHKD